MAGSCYVLGIDLGQAADPTALVLLEHDRVREPIYRLRALHRFPLGTPYTQLPAEVFRRLVQPPLVGQTRLAIDAGGVGRPVVELFKQGPGRIPIYAISITGGSSLTGSYSAPRVPKSDLVATSSVILEQGRLRIAAALPEKDALLDEFFDFRRTMSEAGHESYGAAAGAHDDLVLALSLALWTGENRPCPPAYRRVKPPTTRLPTIEEIIRQRLSSYYNF